MVAAPFGWGKGGEGAPWVIFATRGRCRAPIRIRSFLLRQWVGVGQAQAWRISRPKKNAGTRAAAYNVLVESSKTG